VSVVERSGNSNVPAGATLDVRVGSGQKGQQVTEILSVDISTAAREPARRPRPERLHAPPDQASVEEFGTVKFYAPERGFGFIVRDRGGKDIFVHASTLNRHPRASRRNGASVIVSAGRTRRRCSAATLVKGTPRSQSPTAFIGCGSPISDPVDGPPRQDKRDQGRHYQLLYKCFCIT
jgi:cold shock protein